MYLLAILGVIVSVVLMGGKRGSDKRDGSRVAEFLYRFIFPAAHFNYRNTCDGIYGNAERFEPCV